MHMVCGPASSHGRIVREETRAMAVKVHDRAARIEIPGLLVAFLLELRVAGSDLAVTEEAARLKARQTSSARRPAMATVKKSFDRVGYMGGASPREIRASRLP